MVLRRASPCLNAKGEPKGAYKTREEAHELLTFLIRKGNSPQTTRTYRCKKCSLFHVGHFDLRPRRRH